MGKQHGSINQAGKVRMNTPRVPKTSDKKKSCPRVQNSAQYNRVFKSTPETRRTRIKCNSQQ